VNASIVGLPFREAQEKDGLSQCHALGLAANTITIQVLASLHRNRGHGADSRACAVAWALAVMGENRRTEGHHDEKSEHQTEQDRASHEVLLA
jgi:hypothetical protein